MANRNAEVSRKTKETEISLKLDLDGSGKSGIETEIGFFSHMLELLARHSLCDLAVKASGDTDVDYHHTVEDVGLVFGEAVLKALGDKKGIERYGFASVPMDEALARVSIDLSGRAALVFAADFDEQPAKIGTFDTQLVREFLTALVNNGKFN